MSKKPKTNISQENINEARSMLKITISRYFPLKRKQHRLVGLCPFHTEEPHYLSFNISDKRPDEWICYACKRRGDAIDFVSQFMKISYEKAIKEIA
ncbi:hypothetical protein J4229_00125 [Candidatus Pacearchaeota archaeon]|nr:hypothetical protein [Candidatus Pacearchaeota archaeon]